MSVSLTVKWKSTEEGRAGTTRRGSCFAWREAKDLHCVQCTQRRDARWGWSEPCPALPPPAAPMHVQVHALYFFFFYAFLFKCTPVQAATQKNSISWNNNICKFFLVLLLHRDKGQGLAGLIGKRCLTLLGLNLCPWGWSFLISISGQIIHPREKWTLRGARTLAPGTKLAVKNVKPFF